MGNNRYRRSRRTTPAAGAGFGRMLLASLVLHVVAAIFLSGVVRIPHAKTPAPYRVELVSLPVPRPQAGLPGVVPETPAPKEKVALPAPAEKPVVVKPTPKTPAVQVKPKEKPKEKPKADKPAPVVDKVDRAYENTLDEIGRMKRLKEIREIRQRLERMVAEETQNKTSTVPVGMPSGRGDQAGGTFDAWIKAQITEYWTLSRYQVTRLDLAATVHLEFDARGTRSGYRFAKSSDDARFDDSVRRAVLQLERLPTAPEKPLQFDITFNLKDLLEN